MDRNLQFWLSLWFIVVPLTVCMKFLYYIELCRLVYYARIFSFYFIRLARSWGELSRWPPHTTITSPLLLRRFQPSIMSVPPQTTLLLFVSRSGGSVINCPPGSGSVRNIQILLFYQRFKEISEKKVHYFINFNDKVYYVPKKSCVTVPLTVLLVGLTVLHVGPVSRPERCESD